MDSLTKAKQIPAVQSLLFAAFLMFLCGGASAAANILMGATRGLSAFCVDPFGTTKILGGEDGRSAREGGLDAVGAGNSVETLSFVVTSAADIAALSVTCDGLSSSVGKIAPEKIDIVLVKPWYQDGNAWFTELRDPDGRVLVPELVLHNDALVRTDEKSRANTILSSGKYISADEVAVADKDTVRLQSFALKANAARQLFLRIRIDAETPAGIYKGKLALAADGAPAGTAEITLRVLSYALPAPKSRFSDAHFIFATADTVVNLPAFFTGLSRESLAKDGYVVAAKEDPILAAKRKYHIFTTPATQRQLQARRTISAVSLNAAPPTPGLENPSVWRRAKGLAAYLDGYDGILIPQLAEKTAVWSENHGEYRSRSLIYPATDGRFIPTLAFLALEDAYYDVCYLSLVEQAATALLDSTDLKTAVEGRRALAWLADIAPASDAPATVRLDAIAWLERLRMVKTQPPGAVKDGKDSEDGK